MEQLGQLSLSSGRVDALSERLGDDNSDVDRLARDFEALFVSMMLKTMRESMSQDMFSGDGSDTYGGLFDSFMGQHIAEQGGIGLSTLLQSVASTRPPSEETATQNQIDGHLKAYENAVATGG